VAQALALTILALAFALPVGKLRAFDAGIERSDSVVGRYISLGMTDAPSVWKTAHPRDRRFIYLMDTATGRIQICSDMQGICRTITSSERQSKAIVAGRFSALSVTRASASWRLMHPSDTHTVFSLDSATAQVQICGDMENACVFVSNGVTDGRAEQPTISIVYRRADSAAIAGRMYDRLVAHYGENSVFMDIYNIPFATDWRRYVDAMSRQARIVVALIGPRWLGKSTDGHVRIDDTDDPVRAELEAAFAAKVPIFPVLIDEAHMPGSVELPDGLKKLPDINAAKLDVGRDFDQHMTRIIVSLDQLLARSSPAPTK
jgi:hypothetical protein